MMCAEMDVSFSRGNTYVTYPEQLYCVYYYFTTTTTTPPSGGRGQTLTAFIHPAEFAVRSYPHAAPRYPAGIEWSLCRGMTNHISSTNFDLCMAPPTIINAKKVPH